MKDETRGTRTNGGVEGVMEIEQTCVREGIAEKGKSRNGFSWRFIRNPVSNKEEPQDNLQFMTPHLKMVQQNEECAHTLNRQEHYLSPLDYHGSCGRKQ